MFSGMSRRYTRRRTLDSTNYNQTSMVRTMELILGLPPMNQFDASATPMTSCFTNEIDLTPYTAAPNNIPLDQLNPKVADIREPRQRHWAEVSLKLPLDDIDEADEDTLNRVLWHAARGRDDGVCRLLVQQIGLQPVSVRVSGGRTT